MHRAVEMLLQITDAHLLTTVKFLVDDLGTPSSCNMYVRIESGEDGAREPETEAETKAER